MRVCMVNTGFFCIWNQASEVCNVNDNNKIQERVREEGKGKEDREKEIL